MAAALGALMAAGRGERVAGGAPDRRRRRHPRRLERQASVHDVVRWHVVRGPVHWIDLDNVDAAAVLDPDVAVSSDDGRSLIGAPRSARRPRRARDGRRSALVHARRLHVRRALARRLGQDRRDRARRAPRGASLVVAARLRRPRPGADDPRPPRGARGARRSSSRDTGAVDDSALSTLRREPARDVLELVRPHVGRGESVAWTVRIDPRALPGRGRSAPAARARRRRRRSPIACARSSWSRRPRAPSRSRFGLLVAHKARAFAAACAARGVRARSSCRLPDGLRAAARGARASRRASGCRRPAL